MKRETILLISNQKASSNSLLAAAKATGHRVVTTSSTQAIAFLFIMRCVTAVLMDHFGSEETGFDLARKLRAICKQVPIILLSPHPIRHLPECVDASLNTSMPLNSLPAALLRVLSVARARHLGSPLRQAS